MPRHPSGKGYSKHPLAVGDCSETNDGKCFEVAGHSDARGHVSYKFEGWKVAKLISASNLRTFKPSNFSTGEKLCLSKLSSWARRDVTSITSIPSSAGTRIMRSWRSRQHKSLISKAASILRNWLARNTRKGFRSMPRRNYLT